ncbi:MAG: hypothetical protein HQ557_13805, partial [Bacteroidetes bacterium]|nr:hypothetical protein [Bacteroidota bacterium]
NPLIRSYYTILETFREFIRELLFQLFLSIISNYSVFGQTLINKDLRKETGKFYEKAGEEIEIKRRLSDPELAGILKNFTEGTINSLS